MIFDEEKDELIKSLEARTHDYFNQLLKPNIPSKTNYLSVELKCITGWIKVKTYSSMHNAKDYIYYRELLGTKRENYRIIDNSKDYQ